MGTRSAARPAGAESARPRPRATVGGAVVVLLVAGAAAVLPFVLNAPGGSRAIGTPPAATAGAPGDPLAERSAEPGGRAIRVHVVGAVAEPGLYELTDGDRIVDAVA